MKTSTDGARAVGFATSVVLATVAGAVALLFSINLGGGQAHASGMPASAQLSAKAVTLERTMDKLWEDHITWTRMVIVDFAAGLPDLKAAEARLLRNQADIGNAIKPFYGVAAGNRLTALLRTHILEAVPVLVDAKAGNKARLTRDLAAWYANAHQIAAFLASANPHNWPLAHMDAMMKQHLALTTREAVARLQGHWAADIAAYDAVHAEILSMSHMLSAGIIAQFSSRF